MRWLKAAVAIMGIMIVAMLVTIVVTIFRRMTAPKPAAAPVAVSAPLTPGLPLTADITLPPGATLKDVTGADGRLVLHLVTPDGQESLMLLDPATGKVTLTIALHPAP
jgi:Family of unknown function (DUF6476)